MQQPTLEIEGQGRGILSGQGRLGLLQLGDHLQHLTDVGGCARLDVGLAQVAVEEKESNTKEREQAISNKEQDLEKAKNLLLNPNLRVSEIAYEVGFQSLTHFNRVFKRILGQSPTEYRAQLLAH